MKAGTQIWLFTIALLALAGCGNENGNGLPTPKADSSLRYSGATGPAAISFENGNTLARSSFMGIDSATQMDSAFNRSLAPTTPQPPLTLVLQQVASQITAQQQAYTSNTHTRAISRKNSVYGDCGGQYTYDINIEEGNGSLRGNISFDNFCSSGPRLSGTTSVSGYYDTNLETFNRITLVFSDMRIKEGSREYAISGSFSADLSTTPATAAMSTRVYDSTTGTIFQIDDYRMTVTPRIIYDEFTVAGRFYHPSYGYVDLSTTQPFKIQVGDTKPYEGAMKVTGASNSKVVLSATSRDSYQIEIDRNGDSIIDWSSTFNW